MKYKELKFCPHCKTYVMFFRKLYNFWVCSHCGYIKVEEKEYADQE